MFGPDAAICDYRQVSNIRHTLVGNSIVDHSDVVGAVPRGDAPTMLQLHLSDQQLNYLLMCPSALLQLHLNFPLNTWLQYIAQRQLHAETRNI